MIKFPVKLKGAFKVSFNLDDGKKYKIAIVKKNHTVAKPTDPVKEGYVFKGWLLEDEEFDFDTAINSNITLLARFEEEDTVVWEDTLEFASVGEDMPGWCMSRTEEAFPELDQLNTTDTFTFSIPELDKSVTGKFESGGEGVYIIGEESDGINFQANNSFYAVTYEGEAGTYLVKLTKQTAPTPGGQEFSETLTYTLGDDNTYNAFYNGNISDFINSLDVTKSYSLEIADVVPVEGRTLKETVIEDATREFEGFVDKAYVIGRDLHSFGEDIGCLATYVFDPAISQEASQALGGLIPAGTTVWSTVMNPYYASFTGGDKLTTIKEKIIEQ